MHKQTLILLAQVMCEFSEEGNIWRIFTVTSSFTEEQIFNYVLVLFNLVYFIRTQVLDNDDNEKNRYTL